MFWTSLAADSREGQGSLAEVIGFSVVDIKFEHLLQPITVAVPQLWGQARTRLLGGACTRLLQSVLRKYVSKVTQGAVCTLEHPIQGTSCQL